MYQVEGSVGDDYHWYTISREAYNGLVSGSSIDFGEYSK